MADKSEKAMIKLDGTIIKTDGSEYKSDFFKFLDLNPDDYSDITYTPEEANKIRLHLMYLSTGATAAVPLICGGAAKCPFKEQCRFLKIDKDRKKEDARAKPVTPVGRKCHPPGERILTSSGEYILIEKLDPDVHKLVGYERHHNCVRKGRDTGGYSFKKAAREYNGKIVKIVTESGKKYLATEDHICIARFNEKAVGRFCVYLMRKGKYWRVGKSQILGRYKKDNQYGHKTFLAFASRGNGEKADDMWILGVYNTNTEATLKEDYFSCYLQTSRALFKETPDDMSRRKWNGLYRWADQKQIDSHHESLVKPYCFYVEKLAELGLSIDYPIWTSLNHSEKKVYNPEDTKIKARNGMYIRACNLIPEIMDVPVYPKKPTKYGKDSKSQLWFGQWEEISIEKEDYTGIVYSLEVEKYGTYFINEIATHNCLIEVNLLNQWTRLYIKEYEIDEYNFTDFQMVRELAEIELMLWRLNNNLAKPENAELIQESIVGIDREGNALTRKEINSYIEAKERLQNRKSKIIKLMVGDRQEKYKREAALRIKGNEDPSTNAAQLRGKIDRLLKQAKTLDLQVKEKEGKIIDSKDLPVEQEEEKPLTPDDIINEE